jgi:FdhD protein
MTLEQSSLTHPNRLAYNARMNSTDVPMYRSAEVVRLSGPSSQLGTDDLVAEEPLEIRLNGESLAVTMRTPGQDEALAVGFLTTEGIIASPEDVWDIHRCSHPDHPDQFNIVEVTVPPERLPDDIRAGRQRYASSACGICGSASIDAVKKIAPPIDTPPRISRSVLISLPDRLRSAQQVFERTGGLHASGLFGIEGELLFHSEDVGRHNTVDKVVGAALLAGRWPLDDAILMVSGRAGFEIVQKALVARVPVVCSVSAPSSLAVELARDAGMVLVGFLRGESMNVYSRAENVQ